jgi:type I restriction enzyme S subunit
MVAIGEVCQIISGSTPSTQVSRFWNGDIPWATPKDLSCLGDIYIRQTSQSITEEGYASCSTALVPPYSVLLSSRAPIGYVAINAISMCTNQGFKNLIPDAARLDARFLCFWLKANRSYLESLGNGATFKEISKATVARVEIPLPPLAEQKHIAAILDKADALRRKRREAIGKIDGVLRSAFHQLFGTSDQYPPVSVSAGGDDGPVRTKLTDVARLATGHTPSRRVPEYWGGTVPWISLSDVRTLNGRVATETVEYTNPLGIAHSSAVLLPKDTVCFSRTASVGFVTIMGRDMATSQDFVNWICGPSLDPTYLLWALIFSSASLRKLSTGSTHKTIYFPTVMEFKCFVPPISQQRRFVGIATSMAQTRSKSELCQARLNSLFSSLQAQAFA